MKPILYLVTIPSIFLINSIAKAQNVTSPNTVNSPNQINDVEPIQQPGTFFDPSNGSGQFFQQDRDRLYFLPEEKSEPILQIDESIKEDNEIKQNPAINQQNQNIEQIPALK